MSCDICESDILHINAAYNLDALNITMCTNCAVSVLNRIGMVTDNDREIRYAFLRELS